MHYQPSRILAVVMGCGAAVCLFLGVLVVALLLGSEYEGDRLALAGLGIGLLAGAWKLWRSSMVALRLRADQRISGITFDPSVGWSLAWPDGYHVELGHRINGGMREDYLQVVGWSDREEEIEFAVHPELVGARNVAVLAFLLDNTPRYCPAAGSGFLPSQQCEDLRPDAVQLLVEELKQREDRER